MIMVLSYCQKQSKKKQIFKRQYKRKFKEYRVARIDSMLEVHRMNSKYPLPLNWGLIDIRNEHEVEMQLKI